MAVVERPWYTAIHELVIAHAGPGRRNMDEDDDAEFDTMRL